MGIVFYYITRKSFHSVCIAEITEYFPYSMVWNVVQERSVILNGSKQRRSRQDYFCKMVVTKGKSGSHFSLPLELNERRN